MKIIIMIFGDEEDKSHMHYQKNYYFLVYSTHTLLLLFFVSKIPLFNIDLDHKQ